MTSKDTLKLDIMRALQVQPLSVVQMTPVIRVRGVTTRAVATTLDELVREGFLVTDDTSSTVGRLYKHASETSMSDLRAKVAPYRDPVREAHEHGATQGRSRGYSPVDDEVVDLGEDD